MKTHLTLLFSACLLAQALSPGAVHGEQAGDVPSTRIYSPGRRIIVDFELVDGTPGYRVEFDGREVIRPSRLGFVFRGEDAAFARCTVKEFARRSFSERWEPVWGEKSEIEDTFNEMTVRLQEESPAERWVTLTFRAYDDGVAFRYMLPKQPGLGEYEIIHEMTEFRFTGDHTTWWIPGDYDTYEKLYSATPLSEVQNVNTPVTMKTADGLYVSIHEANLTDYAGLTLERASAAVETGRYHGAVASEETTLLTRLVPWPDGVKVRGETPMTSPWRMIQISPTPGGLIESYMILNLNEPCRIEDTSWIRPMKYMGIWWGMHIKKETWEAGPRHGATTGNAKRHIDFASGNGIAGLLIEGWNTGWERWGEKDAFDYMTPYPDFDIAEVAFHAQTRGVAIIGHHETGGDVEGYERLMDQAFDMYARLGIHAVKTGYAGGIFPRGQHHHGQYMVRHYRKVVETAAKYHITIDAHEPIADTGISRTWPNMMTREGVRGTEYDAWSEGNPPEHTVIIPFTRLLSGPADYTPGIFDLFFEEYQPGRRVHTTLAKQLALYVVIYSPLQMAADLPENYEGHPAFEFIKEVPVDWDDTKVLNAKIGDYVTIARRSGESWYIGSITDENPRVFSVPLDFLTPGISYRATVYKDAPDADWETAPLKYEISDTIVDSAKSLAISLAPGGGQAVSIVPVK